MLHVVLFEPEIPQNTGNIIRLCANVGAKLIIIQPCGFSLSDKHLRRAGLDYHDQACVHMLASWTHFLDTYQPKHLFALTTKGSVAYTEVVFRDDVFLVFGPETRGLPDTILDHALVSKIRIPMQANSRSLNLSNSVAIAVYEVLRQLQFPGCV